MWYDADDLEPEGAQEFLLDVTPPDDEVEQGGQKNGGHASTDSKMTVVDDGKSSIYAEGDDDASASDTDSEDSEEMRDALEARAEGQGEAEETPRPKEKVPEGKKADATKQVVYRTQLPTGPVGDEGSLFAVLKKNVGKVRLTTTPPVSLFPSVVSRCGTDTVVVRW